MPTKLVEQYGLIVPNGGNGAVRYGCIVPNGGNGTMAVIPVYVTFSL